MGTKVVMDSEAAERLMLIATDLDRYEAVVIPDLRAQVGDLTHALQELVTIVDDQRRNHDSSLASRAEAAAYRARRLLAGDGQQKGGVR